VSTVADLTSLISVAGCENANTLNERAKLLNITHVAITGVQSV
jgi:hypothetical protein